MFRSCGSVAKWIAKAMSGSSTRCAGWGIGWEGTANESVVGAPHPAIEAGAVVRVGWRTAPGGIQRDVVHLCRRAHGASAGSPAAPGLGGVAAPVGNFAGRRAPLG